MARNATPVFIASRIGYRPCIPMRIRWYGFLPILSNEILSSGKTRSLWFVTLEQEVHILVLMFETD
jgi:hypothetical protein